MQIALNRKSEPFLLAHFVTKINPQADYLAVFWNESNCSENGWQQEEINFIHSNLLLINRHRYSPAQPPVTGNEGGKTLKQRVCFFTNSKSSPKMYHPPDSKLHLVYEATHYHC